MIDAPPLLGAPEQPTAPQGLPRTPGRPGRLWLLAVPTVLFMAALVLYPLLRIVWLSVSDPELGLGNYAAMLTDGISITIILRTIGVAALVAVLALVIAFPYAYAMTKVSAGTRTMLTLIVLVPFWTSVMARNFALYIFEQKGGIIDSVLSSVGIEDFVLLGTLPGVLIGMVQVMLPMAMLPLYTALSSIDPNLLRASASCGAAPFTAFRSVYLPLSLPGLLSGFSLVFITSLGFYVTPAVLGSPQEALVSQLVVSRVRQLLDFGAGGALAVALLVVSALVLVLVSGLGRRTSRALESGAPHA